LAGTRAATSEASNSGSHTSSAASAGPLATRTSWAAARSPCGASSEPSRPWLDAARGLTSFEGDGDDFRRWLFTIARRRMVDPFRREGRRVDTTPITGHDDPGGSDGAAGEALAGLAAQEAIAALVRDLPESQAEVVLLRVVADLSVEDVAQLTGRSPGAVRVLQHRALRRLATLWDPSEAPR
jgi:RNA polymerase sigma-70 factor (ECF subfamily)